MSASMPRLGPSDVRARLFRRVRLGGLDPADVEEFRIAVAGEIAQLHRDVLAVIAENVQIKDNLRRWQSEQARMWQPDDYPGTPRPDGGNSSPRHGRVEVAATRTAGAPPAGVVWTGRTG